MSKENILQFQDNLDDSISYEKLKKKLIKRENPKNIFHEYFPFCIKNNYAKSLELLLKDIMVKNYILSSNKIEFIDTIINHLNYSNNEEKCLEILKIIFSEFENENYTTLVEFFLKKNLFMDFEYERNIFLWKKINPRNFNKKIFDNYFYSISKNNLNNRFFSYMISIAHDFYSDFLFDDILDIEKNNNLLEKLLQICIDFYENDTLINYECSSKEIIKNIFEFLKKNITKEKNISVLESIFKICQKYLLGITQYEETKKKYSNFITELTDFIIFIEEKMKILENNLKMQQKYSCQYLNREKCSLCGCIVCMFLMIPGFLIFAIVFAVKR